LPPRRDPDAAAGLVVIGVEERERHGGTIYNTLLYFSPISSAFTLIPHRWLKHASPEPNRRPQQEKQSFCDDHLKHCR